MISQEVFEMTTQGRGTYEITETLRHLVSSSGIRTGWCHVFQHHTSASLIVCENAAPSVRRDAEDFFARLVPDGDPRFEHTTEGPDDMAAHIRALLTQTELTVPVTRGHCALGTWQGIYLWEHRYTGRKRQVTVTIQGE